MKNIVVVFVLLMIFKSHSNEASLIKWDFVSVNYMELENDASDSFDAYGYSTLGTKKVTEDIFLSLSYSSINEQLSFTFYDTNFNTESTTDTLSTSIGYIINNGYKFNTYTQLTYSSSTVEQSIHSIESGKSMSTDDWSSFSLGGGI